MLCFVRIRPTFDCVNSVEDMPDRFILFDIELNNINKRSVSANGTSYNESNKSVGAILELGKGLSYSISGSMSKGEVSANGTSYNESNVKAEKDLNFASGNDTKSDTGAVPRQAQ